MSKREDEIRARWAAATPGPWKHVDGFSSFGVDSVSNPQGVIAGVRHIEDQAAIAAAPTDVAWLLEVADAARAQNKAWSANDPVAQSDAMAALETALDKEPTT